MERIPHLGSRGLSSPSKRHTDTQIHRNPEDYLDSASRELHKFKTQCGILKIPEPCIQAHYSGYPGTP